MRLFFALPLPARLHLDLDHWCSHALSAAIDRIPPRNYHMTLAFLGDVPANQFDALTQQTDQALATLRLDAVDRTIRLDQTGYFAKPGIFWIGPSHWPKALTSLSHTLQQIGNRIGCPRTRQPFQPHISLIRNCHDPLAPLAAPDFDLRLDEVVLFESQQARSGVQYHALENWPIETTPTRPFPDRPSLPRRRKG